jgi:tetratricopeptide (TPR) repeat protein
LLLLLVAGASCTAPRQAELEEVQPTGALESMNPPVRRQFEEALARLDRVRADREASVGALAEAYGRLGMLLHAYADRPPAAAAYRNAWRLAPGDFRWPYFLALLSRLQADWTQADRALTAALDLEPDYLPALVVRAEFELDRGRLEAADAAFADLLERDRTLSAAWLGRAKVALARGEPQEALPLLREALARRPEATEVLYLLGQAHAALGEREPAARYLDQIPPANFLREPVGIEDPVFHEVVSLAAGARRHTRSGARAAARENYELALVEFEQALSANPELATARYGRALILVQLGRVEEAVAELQWVLGRAPDRADAWELLGTVLAGAGDPSTAEAALRRALELDPLAERGRSALGDLLRRSGRLEEALAAYERALDTAPALVEAHAGRTATLADLGRVAEADEALAGARRALPEARLLALLAARWQAASPRATDRDAAAALAAARELAAAELDVPAAETVAMALAEAGDFAGARRWQEAAAAAAAGAPRPTPWIERRLALYRARQPCRVSWDPWERVVSLAVSAPAAGI